MRSQLARGSCVKVSAFAVAVLLTAGLAKAQDRAGTTEDRPTPDGSPSQTQALADTVRELQAEVRTLTAQMQELRADEQRESAETRELRDELKQLTPPAVLQADGGSHWESYTPQPSGEREPAPKQTSFALQTADQDQTVDQRLADLEENQELMDAKISEQNQTKVESASKYRVRLSGIVLMNLFENRGTVDNQDIPQMATPPGPLDSAGSFGASLRQSQIGLEAFGPDIAGAHTSANVKFDFAGGFPDLPNGTTFGIMRLRTGTIRLDWTNTSVIAGQDQLFFAPLTPTSLASLAVPALSYAGNLWSWTPQVRVEHRIVTGETSSLLIQGGILDSLSGEPPMSSYEFEPTWGERSGQPAYATRLSWRFRAFDQDVTLGAGGYYGRQSWGFSRNVDGWAGTTDLTLPLGKLFEFTGEFYRGRAVGGLSGALGQDVLVSGTLYDSGTTVKGLDSMGGWTQLKFKPTPKFEVNGAVGLDNPFAGELRRFPQTFTLYGPLLSKNWSPLINFIYQFRSDVLFSAEYRRLQTFQLDSESYSANHIALSLGYLF